MSETKFTPGPWKVENSIYEHMHSEIASVASGSERGIAQVWKHPNAMTDARLIAAAPEMLEALKAIYEWQSGSLLLSTELWEQMRHAIAKAEGGPPCCDDVQRCCRLAGCSGSSLRLRSC